MYCSLHSASINILEIVTKKITTIVRIFSNSAVIQWQGEVTFLGKVVTSSLTEFAGLAGRDSVLIMIGETAVVLPWQNLR